jgi:hypothetical protein
MKSRLALVFLSALALAGCQKNPVGPEAATITLTLPSEVTGRIVVCDSCVLASAPSAVATANLTLANHGRTSHEVGAVETVVANHTRMTILASNRRPNADVGLTASSIPAGGSLTLEAGVVYPVPPPRDDIQLLVIVSLTDGTKVQGQVRLVTTGG